MLVLTGSNGKVTKTLVGIGKDFTERDTFCASVLEEAQKTCDNAPNCLGLDTSLVPTMHICDWCCEQDAYLGGGSSSTLCFRCMGGASGGQCDGSPSWRNVSGALQLIHHLTSMLVGWLWPKIESLGGVISESPGLCFHAFLYVERFTLCLLRHPLQGAIYGKFIFIFVDARSFLFLGSGWVRRVFVVDPSSSKLRA